jgi:GH25 family lysozyme M1 (1,4-beta-N-acetylmuramidase)
VTGVRLLAAALALLAAFAAPGRADAALARGMDVSHWQGAVDWFRVAGGGYAFVFAKATEGMTITDPTYAINRAGATSIGLHIGAYHFARPGGSGDAGIAASAIAQADRFVQVATPQPGDLPPVLDLESRGGLTASQLAAWTQAWLDQVERRLGVKATVYASPNFWKTSMADSNALAAAGFPLWVAHWTKNESPLVPAGNWGGLGWMFWQWTDCTTIPGFAKCLDGDRFNGSSPAVVAIPTLPASVPVAVSAPVVVGTPQAGKLLAAVPGRWNGGRPLTFAYQWQSCDAAGGGCVPISGATAQTYTPPAAAAGHALVVAVTATGSAGAATSLSAPTPAVASGGAATPTAPLAIALPSVAGTPQVGQTLSASVGTWTGSPTSFAYQWRRCAPGGACTSIAGAVSAQYTATPGDIGSALSLVVTATGRGGSRSASSPPTAAVAAAPVPAPTAASAAAVAGAAGAVGSAGGAVLTWQPGAVAAGTVVSVAAAKAKLPLPGTTFRVGIAPLTGMTPWPLDLRFANAADAVVGRLPDAKGVWQAVPELPSASLPEGQSAGSYRDADGFLHVLTRVPGQVALFTAGAWGDPRRVPTVRPTLQRLSGEGALRARSRGDGTQQIVTRLIVSSQARLAVSLRGRGSARATILGTGSRLGVWLHGGAAKSVGAEALTPGGLPVRLRVRAGFLRPGVTYRLIVRSVDPYNRKATLVLPVRR